MFYYLISFVLFLDIVLGANLPLDPIPEPEGRIVGGEDCKIEEAPYQVAALCDVDRDGNFEKICGGSIISENFVVTAAHCTSGTLPCQWKIRVGSADITKGGETFSVARIIQHEKFDILYVFNDISLFLLDKELTFDETVSPISLPVQEAAVPDGSPALVTGWGDTTGNKDYPDTLRKVVVPIVNQRKCIDVYFEKSNEQPITNDMICAGLVGKGKTPCGGDSGGPLVVNETLFGITSMGNCTGPSLPAVFTRVSMYVDWIQNNTENPDDL